MKKILVSVAIIILPLFLYAGEGQIRRSPHAVANEYIVVLNDDTPAISVAGIAQQLESQHGGSVQRVWKNALKGFFIKMNEGQAQGLSHNPKVKFVEEVAEIFLSGRIPTNVDPSCNPLAPCSVKDNRLWHLDVLDQNAAIPSHDFAYCTDGSNVYVYVVDTGVMRAHAEFDPSRVTSGYNASGDNLNGPLDYYPAYDPCHGSPTAADRDMNTENGINSHGTGVASLVAGRNLGVAKNAIIVPIKVRRCGESAARYPQRSALYQVGTIVDPLNGSFFRAASSGTTAVSAPSFNLTTGSFTQDGQVSWECLNYDGLMNPSKTSMLIDGLDWIVRPLNEGGNPNPWQTSPSVVTLSTFFVPAYDPSGVSSVEAAIATLLQDNIVVVASANNQDANACDTSPGRMSRNNPSNMFSNKEDLMSPYRVITAGGTMIFNNVNHTTDDPPNPATGGSFVNLAEPAYDSAVPTTIRRWRCYAGDSNICSSNIVTQQPWPAHDPVAQPLQYSAWELGSNGGQCVTLFAPAKNIPVATIQADSVSGSPTYRNARATSNATSAPASGTSWSAPIVAGTLARLMQGHTYTVAQAYSALMGNATTDLDPTDLNPPGVTGTPNALLHIPDVTVTPLPYITSGVLTASAAGTGTLAYQWYQVNANFNLAASHANAAGSALIPGATSATLGSPTANVSYFVRVFGSCGSADSNITTFIPCQAVAITAQPTSNPQRINSGSSSTLSISVSGGVPITVQWYTSAGAFVASGTSISVSPSIFTNYYAIVSNACGSLQSSYAGVDVCVPPGLGTSLAAHPSTITVGQASILKMDKGTGSSPLVHSWYKSDGTFVGSANTQNFSVSPTVTTSYYYILSNTCGTTNPSPMVTVTVQ